MSPPPQKSPDRSHWNSEASSHFLFISISLSPSLSCSSSCLAGRHWATETCLISDNKAKVSLATCPSSSAPSCPCNVPVPSYWQRGRTNDSLLRKEPRREGVHPCNKLNAISLGSPAPSKPNPPLQSPRTMILLVQTKQTDLFKRKGPKRKATILFTHSFIYRTPLS